MNACQIRGSIALLSLSALVSIGTFRAPVLAQAPEEGSDAGAAVIRIITPGRQVSGKTVIETLTIDPDILSVVFFVDGQEEATRNRPPYEVKVDFASPPREQTVRVVAFGRRDVELGEDSIVVNRVDPPFRVQITEIEGDPRAGSVTVSADVSVPRKAVLERVDFYRNAERVATLRSGPFSARIDLPTVSGEDFVRVEAVLEDGLSLEDVRLFSAPAGITERVEVHLVQLQVLVTDKYSNPIRELQAKDFEIRHGGKVREIQRLYIADDISLVLGMALDSSGSMATLWSRTKQVAGHFLNKTLTDRDQAFLVDFDTHLRLAEPLTGSVPELVASLESFDPEGGTALYDAMLFSLLQFENEPGRRGLVVLTDGIEASSFSDPRRAVEFGQKLGVPIYLIALEAGRQQGVPSAGGGFGSFATGDLKLITDPTGGRLFQVVSFDQAVRAFDQINLELRNQYVMTFYTDRVPSQKDRPQVKVVGRKGLKVRTVFGEDQVN